MNIYGRNYEYKSEQGLFFVDGKDGSETRGQSFYKYYSLEEYSVDALSHLYLYATHPNLFNDPLDCAEELIHFNDMQCIQIFWDELYPAIESACCSNEEEMKFITQKAYKTYLYMKWGIVCLSRKYDDLSMWASYSNHKGFCVEFDFTNFPYRTTGPFSINYQKSLTSINVKDVSVQLATLLQTNVKQDCWKHEEEWRLLVEQPSEFYFEPFGDFATTIKSEFPDYHDRKLKYSIRNIKSVTLGLKFFSGLNCIIKDLENEYVTNNELQNKVLSFLSLSRIPTYVLDVDKFQIIRTPIKIVQIRNNTYRILYY